MKNSPLVLLGSSVCAILYWERYVTVPILLFLGLLLLFFGTTQFTNGFASFANSSKMELSSSTIAQTVPSDVFYKIASYLPLKDVFRLQKVCRHWRNCAKDHFKTVRILCLTGVLPTTLHFNTFQHLFHMTKSMDIDMKAMHSNEIRLDWDFVRQKHAERISQLFPNLKEVYLIENKFWPTDMNSFVAFCQHLFQSVNGIQKLAIGTLCNEQIMTSIVQNLQSLNTLILFHIQFPETLAIKSYLKRLKRLCLPNRRSKNIVLEGSMTMESITFKPDDYMIEGILQKMLDYDYPNLQHVGFSLSQNSCPIGIFSELLSTQPIITSLELYNDNRFECLDIVYSVSLITLLMEFPVLKSLTISVSFWWTELLNVLAKKADEFPALEAICLQTQNASDVDTMFSSFFHSLPTNRSPKEVGSAPKIVIENSFNNAKSVISDKLRNFHYAFPVEVKDLGFVLKNPFKQL